MVMLAKRLEPLHRESECKETSPLLVRFLFGEGGSRYSEALVPSFAVESYNGS
jgi:hypothetical protein